MDEKTLGEKLRSVRKSRKHTLKDVASILKVSFDYVSRIEKGDREPSGIVKAAIDDYISSKSGSKPLTISDLSASYSPEAKAIADSIEMVIEGKTEDERREIVKSVMADIWKKHS